MWTIGYIHYITNKIAYITYSHVDQDIPYQLKCDKGLFHAWDIMAVGLQEHIYNGIANYDIIWRNRQALWGECTEANPKLLLNGT